MKYYLFLIFLFFTFLANAQLPTKLNGKLRVCGTNLCNSKGQKVQLRGLSTHGLQWYGWNNCIVPSSIELVREWNANVLRVSLYIREGGYASDPDRFLSQLEKIVEYATETGLYVIIDWHVLNPGDPNADIALATQFFATVSKKYAKSENIIYEICNEPNGVSWSRIRKYADMVIPLIQKNDNDAVIIVGTPGWSSLGVSDGSSSRDILNNLLPYSNIMYSFHFYAAQHREKYLDELMTASEKIPLFVTEFGLQKASGDGVNDFDMGNKFMDSMDRKKISWVYWNFSDDSRSGAIWKEGACKKKQWTDSDLKPAGIWIKEQLARKGIAKVGVKR